MDETGESSKDPLSAMLNWMHSVWLSGENVFLVYWRVHRLAATQ